jgi:hypothetical protein
MAKKILLGIVIVLVALAVLIAAQPAKFRVTRTTTINAPAADVHGLINDFHNWESWSPWGKLDPQMKTTYEGPAAGTGSVYKWTGNQQVGEGQMTILESQPPNLVKIKLDFIKPFASTSSTNFEVRPEGTSSSVIWTMSGENNFISKAFCLFTGGMDKMIGPDFEKGLAQMKSVAEKKST